MHYQGGGFTELKTAPGHFWPPGKWALSARGWRRRSRARRQMNYLRSMELIQKPKRWQARVLITVGPPGRKVGQILAASTWQKTSGHALLGQFCITVPKHRHQYI